MPLNVDVLILLGIGVFGGTVGALLLQRFHIPQVLGYIAVGLIIGEPGFRLIEAETLIRLETINLFALGIIGFLVGGELHRDTFRNQGKQLGAILLGEGLGAFVLVSAAVAAVVFVVSDSWPVAIAAGLVFGAISSATDPASTMNVLWEYRSRGILTTTLIAIVALDDALAMTLYGLGTSGARMLSGEGQGAAWEAAMNVALLFGAVGLGAGMGWILNYVTRWLKRPENVFACAVGALLLVIGVAAVLEMDVILAAMTLGLTLVNLAPRRSRELFHTVRGFANPIYVIFFVLVGARLDVAAMPSWLWIVVAVYVVGRGIGKVGGAWFGARISGAEPVVRKYTGVGLFAQGGIAVGLSIMAGHHLSGTMVVPGLSLGDMIIFGITASTLVVQVAGPPLVRWASARAGELGRDVTEEDVVTSWTVSDAMTRDIEPITLQTPLTEVFRIFAENEHLVYPVVDSDKRLRGIIALDDLKEIVISPDTWPWVLAMDVMVSADDRTSPDAPLADALDFMRQTGVEELPVVTGNGDGRAIGILDQRSVRIRVNEELLRRRQKA